MRRKIVRINADKCDGCGLCVSACAEGAIALVDGKARVVSESCCDGLGACLGECPQGAITIEDREAPAFDPAAVAQHLARAAPPAKSTPKQTPLGGGTKDTHTGHSHAVHACPGSRMRQMARRPAVAAASGSAVASASAPASQLQNWPVQLHLLSPTAPYLQGADLLICADCVPFALPDFHQRLLAGRVVAIGCPKLDIVEPYVEKLTAIFTNCNIRSVTVAHMEVPCCTGIVRAVQAALAASGRPDTPLRDVTVGIDGTIQADRSGTA